MYIDCFTHKIQENLQTKFRGQINASNHTLTSETPPRGPTRFSVFLAYALLAGLKSWTDV
jgi:hypothetical protein